MTTTNRLYIIPTPIWENGIDQLSPEAIKQLHEIDTFVVEAVRTARRFLVRTQHPTAIDDMHFYTLDKRTSPQELAQLKNVLATHQKVGLMSEAGCPAIADPGAALVAMAHDLKIPVVPLVGPSSLLLALMASGLNGQQFHFHGYLPIQHNERAKSIQSIEQASLRNGATQIFIETPYRNQQLFATITQAGKPKTRLCIASQVGAPDAFIQTKTIAEWKKSQAPPIHKQPAVFLLQA